MNIGIRFRELADLPKELSETKFIYENKALFKEQRGESLAIIREFQRINFFVGANNSGKSRFIRGLFKLSAHRHELFLRDHSISAFHTALIKDGAELTSRSKPPVDNARTFLRDLIDLANLRNKNTIIEVLSNKFDYKGFYEKYGELKKIIAEYRGFSIPNHARNYLNSVSAFGTRAVNLVEEIKFHQDNIYKNKVYLN